MNAELTSRSDVVVNGIAVLGGPLAMCAPVGLWYTGCRIVELCSPCAGRRHAASLAASGATLFMDEWIEKGNGFDRAANPTNRVAQKSWDEQVEQLDLSPEK